MESSKLFQVSVFSLGTSVDTGDGHDEGKDCMPESERSAMESFTTTSAQPKLVTVDVGGMTKQLSYEAQFSNLRLKLFGKCSKRYSFFESSERFGDSIQYRSEYMVVIRRK